MAGAGVVLAGLAAYVLWRRGTKAGVWLAVLLVAVAWWAFAYAVELSTSADKLTRMRWGDLKYVGVCALAPAWLLFVLHYTGRGPAVTRRLTLGLVVEPVVVLAVLAVPSTHDLVRFYKPSRPGDDLPLVGTGPVFWVHLVYANLVILYATSIFLMAMVGLSRTYRRMALVLVTAALLPWVANLAHNLEVTPWFAERDLTPMAFAVTGGVLVWGLFRQRLLNLSPLARSVIVETMDDGVVVLDAFGHIADVNPAAERVLNGNRAHLVGLALADLLAPSGETTGQVTLRTTALLPDERSFDVRRQSLTDRDGQPAGELVVLRDITDRVHAERRLQELLTAQSRVAAALQASLVPHRLPSIPSTDIANRYEPAGDGSEIGGDFFDVFTLDQGSWGMVLGDVSGKGAEAAAVTALARYTLRALAQHDHPPSRTLREVNARLLADTEIERHCTLVYAIARPTCNGVDLTLSLAGHHPPLVLRGSGVVEPVGRLGTALGLLDEPELYDSTATLDHGDLICMFTDGLVEARDGTDLFGTERVASLLAERRACSPEEVAEALVGAARRFHQDHDLTDDLALLLMRVQKPVAGHCGVVAPH
jgi:serine phosphatase RsbU (regulator of sigma subunit)